MLSVEDDGFEYDCGCVVALARGVDGIKAIETMKMGLRKRRTAGVRVMRMVCVRTASKRNSQSWSVVHSRKKA